MSDHALGIVKARKKPKTKSSTYRLPVDTVQRIKELAGAWRCSEADVIDGLVHGTRGIPFAPSPYSFAVAASLEQTPPAVNEAISENLMELL